MKIFISLFMVLALVVTAGVPATSHAMMSHDSAKVEKAEASTGRSDCHKHAKAQQPSNTAQNDKGSDACCDKGMCTCVGGNCHNFSKYFGNGSNSLTSLSSNSSAFAFDSQFVECALVSRLKRPPKA